MFESKAFAGVIKVLQTSAKDQLRTIIVYSEATGNGFDVKALRAVIRIRKQDENKRREAEAVLTTYLHALGMTAEAEAA